MLANLIKKYKDFLRKEYICQIEKQRAKKQMGYRITDLIGFLKNKNLRILQIPDSVYGVEYEDWEYGIESLIKQYIKTNDLELIQMNNRYGFNNIFSLTSSLVFLQRYNFGFDCLPFLECIKNFNPKWTVAFDIGANEGIVSCFLAKYSEYVHSFEPSKTAIRNFEKNITVNDFANVKLNKVAVGDKDGESLLFDCGLEQSGHNSLIKHEKDVIKDQYKVPVITISSYCNQHNISKIDFMKIDVEGMEMAVFNGMRDMIGNRQIEMICFEISGEIVEDWEDEKEILRILSDAGYSLFDTRLRGIDVDELMYKRIHKDVFAIEKNSVEFYKKKYLDGIAT